MRQAGAAEKAALMAKFQAGLDSSTMADRFNYQGYAQIVRHFRTDDHHVWDLGRCPVPIRLDRVKTGAPYTTFIYRDAVSALRDYLVWRGTDPGGRCSSPGRARSALRNRKMRPFGGDSRMNRHGPSRIVPGSSASTESP